MLHQQGLAARRRLPSCTQEADLLPQTAHAGGGASPGREWRPVYYSLRAVLKMTTSMPELLISEACDALWPATQALMLHPHTWVRSVAGRAIGQLLSVLQPKALLGAANVTDVTFDTPDMPHAWCAREGYLGVG